MYSTVSLEETSQRLTTTLCPSVLESQGEVHHPFSLHDLAAAGKADGKNHHVGPELQTEDLAHGKETIIIFSLVRLPEKYERLVYSLHPALSRCEL